MSDQILTVEHSQQVQTFVLNINEHQTALIKCLGEPYILELSHKVQNVGYNDIFKCF
jgi:hypothetical protein